VLIFFPAQHPYIYFARGSREEAGQSKSRECGKVQILYAVDARRL